MQELKPRRSWDDLSWIEQEEFGLVVFAGGEVGYTTIQREGINFLLRIESGWWDEYRADGTPIYAGRIVREDKSEELAQGSASRKIVAFIPVPLEQFSWLARVAFSGFNP